MWVENTIQLKVILFIFTDPKFIILLGTPDNLPKEVRIYGADNQRQVFIAQIEPYPETSSAFTGSTSTITEATSTSATKEVVSTVQPSSVSLSNAPGSTDWITTPPSTKGSI